MEKCKTTKGERREKKNIRNHFGETSQADEKVKVEEETGKETLYAQMPTKIWDLYRDLLSHFCVL